MAVTTKDKYLFQDFKLQENAPFFELTSLKINFVCLLDKYLRLKVKKYSLLIK